VLISNAGEEFAVPVDRKLRAALRGDHARLGQLEMKMESALRPRDIQARIRGGESAEEVAAAAQTTVDAIMGFAAPVLAERAHIADNARKSSIRRRSTDATTAAGTLDQASRTHLSTVGVRADDVEWDAWRREDGRWTLVALYAVAGAPRRAEFTYDQPGRYVVADNDEARLLTGESTAAPETATGTRRLASVPRDRRVDDELPLGDDAIELVRDRALDPAADHGDADWIAERRAAEPEHDAEPPAEDVAPTEDTATEDTAPVDTDRDGDREGAEPPAAQEPRQAPPRVSRPQKKGRSSVPSWDEIMFGGGKGD
ncbi:MAG TPA: septation protein SepH, partial [Marmoricola sp.]|nr:septation protein SepH [Marmoricola sp.]